MAVRKWLKMVLSTLPFISGDTGDIINSNNTDRQAVFDITQQQLLECILIELREINFNIKMMVED